MIKECPELLDLGLLKLSSITSKAIINEKMPGSMAVLRLREKLAHFGLDLDRSPVVLVKHLKTFEA
jgi:hypothetical protein